ncbi:uncharacterized, partial [Tachysurus ichikawai]
HQHPGLVGQHTSIPGWSASTPASRAGRPAHQQPAPNVGPAYHNPKLVPACKTYLMLDQ